MSSTVDQRIVEMQFNNKQFESGISTSINSLDKLKKSLDMRGAAKGLSELQNAGKSISFDGLASSVDSIANRFSNLGIVGMTVLQDLTSMAINAGKQIASALTIDPVFSGFQEYETQINAIQTILANTSHAGTTLDDVTAALDELNHYADQTIYNFTEMTRNIGTFTAAGVDLETSVAAIKGIANLAAVSGSNAEQASRAMYQLSQAIAAGKVNLQDWNSVVNAGMGGKIFQDSLKETALIMGKTIDETQSFRESISDKGGTGWLTSDVLLATLEKFTGDLTEAELKAQGYTEEQIKSIIQMGKTANAAATEVKTFTQLFDTLKESAQSGWTQTWEIIIGDFNEAKGLLTKVSDYIGGIISKSADARNALAQGWKDAGGRDMLLTSIKQAFEGLLSVIVPIQKAFRNIFPPTTVDQLVDLTKKLESFTKELIVSDENAKKIQTTFEGLFSIIRFGLGVVGALAKGVYDLAVYLSPLAQYALDGAAALGSFLKNIDEIAIRTDIVNRTVSGLTDFIKKVGDAFVEASNKLYTFITGLEDLSELVEIVKKAVRDIIAKVAPVFETLTGIIRDFFESISTERAFAIAGSGALAVVAFEIFKFIKSLKEVVDDGGGFIKNFTDIFDGVKESLSSFQESLEAKKLITIAIALGILTASIVALSTVEPERLVSSLSGMAVLFTELFGSIALFEKFASGMSFKGMGRTSVMLIALASAISILTGSLKELSKLSWDDLVKGLEGIGVLAFTLTASAKSLTKNTKSLIGSAFGLILFATSITILTSSVKSLSELNFDQLLTGLVGVGVLCAEIAAFLKVADFDKIGITKGVGLIALATSLVVLANAVKSLSALDNDALVRGLTSVGTLLLELSLFMELTKGAKNVISTSVGLTILGGAMLIFAEAIGRLGELSWEEISKGLLTLGSSLSIIAVALYLMPKNMIAYGTGMVAISAGLVILAEAMKSLSSMTWEEISKGLIALAGSLSFLAIAMNAMRGTLSGAAALVVMAAGLNLLIPALKSLADMSIEDIVKSLLTLVGVFAVLGVSASLLSPLIPALLGLAGAVALFGAACLAIGAAVSLLAAGLTALSIAGAAGSAALIGALAGVISLVPLFISKVGEGIIELAKVIGEGAPTIAQAVVDVLGSILAAITELIPQVVETVVVVISSILQTIAEHLPDMIESGMSMLLAFLQGIANNIQAVVESAITIVVNFINGVASKLPDVIDAGFNLVISFINGIADGIRENTDDVVSAVGNLADAMIDGMVNGITSGIGSVVNSVKELGSSALNGLKDILGIHSPSKEFESAGIYSVEGYTNGIQNVVNSVILAMTNLGQNAINALSLINPKFMEAGKAHMNYLIMGYNQSIPLIQAAIDNILAKIIYQIQIKNPSMSIEGRKLITSLLNGIRDMTNEAMSVARSLVERIVGEVSSKSNALYSAGRSLASSLADGLRAGISEVIAAAEELADAAANAAGSGGSSGGGIDYGKNGRSISPVMDMANYRSGVSAYGMGSTGGMTLARSMDVMSRTSQSMQGRGFTPEKSSLNPKSQAPIQYIQNNYSPKALSRIDIYRQTKNLLSVKKGEVHN